MDSKRDSGSAARRGRGPQRRGEETRLRILAATLRVVARRGIGATTFREVAAESGVGLGVVTYHFATRRELLAGAYALHLEQTDEAGRAFAEKAFSAEAVSGWRAGGADGAGGALVDSVVGLLRTLVEDERESFVAGLELTLELTRNPGLARGVREARSRHRDAVGELVARRGSDDPEIDAEILSATFEGLALKWLAQPGDSAFEARLRRAVARLMERFPAA